MCSSDHHDHTHHDHHDHHDSVTVTNSMVPTMENLSIDTNEKLKKTKKTQSDSEFPLEHLPPPAFLQHRLQLWEKLKKEEDDRIASLPNNAIKITLLDGRVMDGEQWKTTPLMIAKMISQSLASNVIVAKIEGLGLWDVNRPLEGDCVLELMDWNSGPEARAVFWHSSAHVLGECCERHYACHLCLGPPLDDGGFYYEMLLPSTRNGGSVTQTDYPYLNAMAKLIIKEKQVFERLLMKKEDLLTMFKDNEMKVRLISEKVKDGTSSTVYKCGPLIDFCLGPHIPHTGRIKAFQVMKNSSSYFLGSADEQVLQRIYGISFPEVQMMKDHLKFLEEADKRDHRKLGKDQQLFFFHDLSPGSAFFLPHGARIYSALQDFIRQEYRKRGFEEVITPNIFNINLWRRSGHLQNYEDGMFFFELDKEKYALKPMNCPGHCLIFGHRERSYKELPIRMADFGVLHRNELSGALGGLTRVRRFQQDDAHIFCRHDQVGDEIKGCLEFLENVYGIFGFTFSLALSTRPEKYMGAIEVWNEAEDKLREVLNDCGHPWTLNPADGAFYGPKIDITISDAHKRRHQCATIQLDFQLPERFELEYRNSNTTDGGDEDAAAALKSRPVIIHRAILGSIERMFAILVESYAGRWPLWLSPRQIIVIPVSKVHNEYAKKVCDAFFERSFHAETDLSDLTLNKKIRNAECAHHTFIIVVGSKEMDDGTVNVRKGKREARTEEVTSEQEGEFIFTDLICPLEDAINSFEDLRRRRQIENYL